MLGEVFIGYKSLHPMDLFGSKMLKADHQGPVAVPDTLRGWVGLMESSRRGSVSRISVPVDLTVVPGVHTPENCPLG